MSSISTNPYYRCGNLQISTNRVNRGRKTAIYTIRNKESVQQSINQLANNNDSLIVYKSSDVCTRKYKKYETNCNNVATNIYNDIEELATNYPEDTLYIMGCDKDSAKDIFFISIH